VVLQFSFAALLCLSQPIDFGTAFYKMMLTSTTVGLGEVKITTSEAKIVMSAHILLTVGTLFSILREIGRITEVRRKLINRLRLMMRKMDPNLLNELEESYFAYYVTTRMAIDQAAAAARRPAAQGHHHHFAPMARMRRLSTSHQGNQGARPSTSEAPTERSTLADEVLQRGSKRVTGFDPWPEDPDPDHSVRPPKQRRAISTEDPDPSVKPRKSRSDRWLNSHRSEDPDPSVKPRKSNRLLERIPSSRWLSTEDPDPSVKPRKSQSGRERRSSFKRPSLQFDAPADMEGEPKTDEEAILRIARQTAKNMRDAVMRRATNIGQAHAKPKLRPATKEEDAQAGMDKAEFVVGMLVLLGVCEWEDAEPIMEHFEHLDVNKSGRLESLSNIPGGSIADIKKITPAVDIGLGSLGTSGAGTAVAANGNSDNGNAEDPDGKFSASARSAPFVV
jgi:hypothetical protein